MERIEITKKVQSILYDFLSAESMEATEGADLRADLGADSLDVVEIIMEVEKEFNIAIPDGDASGVKTVGDLINQIENGIATP